MIYSRWGIEVEVLRLATRADVEKMDPPLDDEALINLAAKSWVVVDVTGTPQVVHLRELRADDGWKEIAAKLGTAWTCPDCEHEWPNDETCHNDACLKKQQQRLARWRKKLAAS